MICASGSVEDSLLPDDCWSAGFGEVLNGDVPGDGLRGDDARIASKEGEGINPFEAIVCRL